MSHFKPHIWYNNNPKSIVNIIRQIIWFCYIIEIAGALLVDVTIWALLFPLCFVSLFFFFFFVFAFFFYENINFVFFALHFFVCVFFISCHYFFFFFFAIFFLDSFCDCFVANTCHTHTHTHTHTHVRRDAYKIKRQIQK